MKLRTLFAGIYLALICSLVLAVVTLAQVKAPEVLISAIDPAQFPQMRVRVAPTQSDGTLISGLGQGAFRVYEDGAERPVEGVNTVERGAQVAFVLDASGSINSNGATKRLRSQEAIEAIDDLVMTDKWVNRSKLLDRWLLIVPKGDKDVRVAQDWTNQPVAIHNNAYAYDFKGQIGDTPLYAMLVEALARFKDVPDSEARPKYLVVLSDGVDRTSKSDIADVINRANRLGVKVISIKLGPEADGATANLYRLAKETDGALVASYTGPDALSDAYGRIRSQRSPYEIAYRSAVAASGKHSVAVGVQSGGQEVRSPATEFGITVEPPKVRIVEPASPATFERVADRWDADLKTLSPREVPIGVDVTWPEGRARAVQQITYLVDGVAVSTLKPDQKFVWDISALPAGLHAVVAEVKDEQGVIVRSEPLQATIKLVIPPAPTPTSLAPIIIKEIEERTTPLSILNAVALGIAGLALLVALYVMLKYRVPQRIGSAVGDAAKALTEGSRNRRKRPTLVMLNSDDSPGKVIPLRSQQTKIGRNPELANLILSDSTVSRLHATIEESTDGVYFIKNEGGSQGTYVNDQEAPISGMRLKDQDVIELGDVRLRFVQPPAGQSPPGKQPSDGSTKADDTTDASLRHARRAK